METTTTNYEETLLIDNFLQEKKVPIVNLINHPRTLEHGGTFLEPINIDPKTVGVLEAMFKQIVLTVKYFTYEKDNERCTTIHMCYRYEHPGGGSNGYDVAYICKDGKNFELL